MPSDSKYWAFISYSHQDNIAIREDGSGDHMRWANWLHEQLETYRVPRDFLKGATAQGDAMPERFFPVFRDEAELPTSHDLGGQIREALECSRFLIVIASPRSAQSRYVNEEARYFRHLGRGDRIMVLIIDGEPKVRPSAKAGYKGAQECFCPALIHSLKADGNVDPTVLLAEEPIAADVRVKDAEGPIEMRASEARQGNRQALLEFMKLKLISGMMGVGLDDLAQRDKQRQVEEAKQRARRARRLAAAFAVLAAVAVAAGVFAWQARSSAIIQQKKAEEALAALRRERTAMFDSTLRYLVGSGYSAAPSEGFKMNEGQVIRFLVPVTRGLEYAFVIKLSDDPNYDVAFHVYDEAGNLLDNTGSEFFRWFRTEAGYHGMVDTYLHAKQGSGEAELVMLRRARSSAR